MGFFISGLALLFIGLKLGGVAPVANWSWGYVLAPIWSYALFLVVVFAVSLAVFAWKELR